MGDEISRSEFSQEDFEKFGSRLRNETRILMKWFDQNYFEITPGKCGFELEAWLLDENYLPSPINEIFLKKTADPLVVPELSKFNFELNSHPHDISGPVLSRMESELTRRWDKCADAAKELDSKIMAIGVLPTIQNHMLNLEAMSSLKRFSALNQQILRLRNGQALELNIEGKDALNVQHHDVMLEAVATSLQIHLQVNPQNAVRLYNLSQIVSAPMVGVAANSPYLFCKDLWDETRIPVFEQAVSVASFRDNKGDAVGRVTFGTGYAKQSILEPFLENLNGFPVLLPTLFDQNAEQLCHLRLQNGTIWRWTRPLIGLDDGGNPHIRLEQRVPASGPSHQDVIANIAFFLGLMKYYGAQETPLECEIPFEVARDNFYSASRFGMNATVKWKDRMGGSLQSLIKEVLLPAAKVGLQTSGLSQRDIDHYLGNIIGNRVVTGQNGSIWQRAFIKKHGQDFQEMTHHYFENQRRNLPVSEWTV